MSNLTGRPPYQKGSAKKKSKDPTAKQRARWERIRALGCILTRLSIPHACGGRITIQHCFTGGGGRKNHDLVVPLCEDYHTGPDGIDGRKNFSKKTWQETFATEHRMLAMTEYLMNHGGEHEDAEEPEQSKAR